MNNERKLDLLKEYETDNSIYNNEVWKKEFPKKLYRYRPLGKSEKDTENELDAIQSDKVWGAVVDSFNDETAKEFTNVVKLNGTNEDINMPMAKMLVSAIKNNNGDANKTIKEFYDVLYGKIPQEYTDIAEYLSNELSSIPKDEKFYSKGEIDKEVLGLLSKISEFSCLGKPEKLWKKRFLLTCFSDNNSKDMWETYANDYNGFCVVYNFEKMINNSNYVLPVHYTDAILDFEFEEQYKTFFLKKLEFSKETEWRMLKINEENSEKGALIKILKPDEIICGKNVLKHDETRLRKICEEKGIKFSKEQ